MKSIRVVAAVIKVGLDPNKDYISDDDVYELSEKVSSYLQQFGFGKDYEITEEGRTCEKILDTLADIE